MGWNEKVLGGRVPDVCAPRQLRKRAGLIRSNGSWTHCSQQVHGQECWQGPVPPSREAAPFSLSPYQQDALLRGRRSPPLGCVAPLAKSRGLLHESQSVKSCSPFERRMCTAPRLSRHSGVQSLSFLGVTKFTREDYVAWKQEGRIQPDGVNAKLYENHG